MARSAAPSIAPIVKCRGRINGLRCLSPRGRVGEARRHRGLAVGHRRRRRDRGLCFFAHFLAQARRCGARRGETRPMAIHLCTTSRMSSVLNRNIIPISLCRWFRPEGRPTFLARKKVGKETHPAFRGPSGCPRCPNAQQVTSPTRPAGSDSEVTFSADHSDDSARQRDWGRANLKRISDLEG